MSLIDPLSSDASRPEGRRGNLSDSVYDAIANKIASGGYAPGQLLPKEEELAQEYGVSRTVLREALIRLRHEGQIESKRGTGNRIVGPQVLRPAPMFVPVQPHSIADLQACFEFRQGLEPNIAALAALRADRSDLERIAASATALEKVVRSGSLGAEEDIAFHTAITMATRNTYYIRTITAIAVPVEVGMRIAGALAPTDPAARLQTTLDEHRAILRALEAQDPDAARQAMERHIEASMARVFTGTVP
jgi:GntR family transcriptional repressor for pyruvate dehydrogenase complex